MLGDNESTINGTATDADMGESFLDLGENLNDVPDLILIDDNTEARVRLTKAIVKDSKTTAGNKYIEAYVVADDFPNSPAIRIMMMLPSADSDAKQKMDRLRNIKDFCTAFGVQQVGTKLLLEAAVANQPWAWAIIGIEKGEGEYKDKNRIKRFVAKR
jgi:hypothetical protein